MTVIPLDRQTKPRLAPFRCAQRYRRETPRHAARTMVLTCLGGSLQPLICWWAQIKTALPAAGTPYRLTKRSVMSHQPSTGAGRKPRKGKCCTHLTPGLRGLAASSRVCSTGWLCPSWPHRLAGILTKAFPPASKTRGLQGPPGSSWYSRKPRRGGLFIGSPAHRGLPNPARGDLWLRPDLARQPDGLQVTSTGFGTWVGLGLLQTGHP